jgi:predicted O-methyltransferase YrrM
MNLKSAFKNKLSHILKAMSPLPKAEIISEFSSAGHFYSPIPGPEDILRREVALQEPTGIDFNVDNQVQLLQSLHRFYPEMPFSEQLVENGRFSFAQNYFCHSDAIYLYSMLRHFKPRRFIEIGSGHSSALAMDTAEFFLDGSLEFTFIEPYPDRLKANLKPQDSVKCRLIEKQVQDLPLEIFDELDANDFLFVDSSHVSKVGSDVNYILFKILPRLKPGVLVHIHDIFFPFEYPEGWFNEGRAWNEAYLVRAFLQYNRDFKVLLFADYLGKTQREFLAENMPLCLKDTGGSLWLQKNF